MKPKDKALEIFNHHYISIFNINCDYSEECLISILAQKHAIITVDEIIKSINVNTGNSAQSRLIDELNKFYIEVKTEIEKL